MTRSRPRRPPASARAGIGEERDRDHVGDPDSEVATHLGEAVHRLRKAHDIQAVADRGAKRGHQGAGRLVRRSLRELLTCSV